jgi:hypothetical protein
VSFTEDLTLFFDQDDFAVAAIIKNGATVIRTISVIFNTPSQELEIFDASVESNLPFVQCASSDMAGITNSHTMTISLIVYRIVKIEPDGTGTSIVQLRK